MKSEGDLCPPSDFDVLINTILIFHHGFFTESDTESTKKH